MFDPTGAQPVMERLGLRGAVRLSADGSTLLVGGPDGASTYDARTLRPVGALLPSMADSPGSLMAVSRDGRYAAQLTSTSSCSYA